MTIDKRLAARLGLAEADGVDVALSALDKLYTDNQSLAARLSVAEERAKSSETALALSEDARKLHEKAALDIKVEADLGRLYQTGKLLRSEGGPSPLEASLRGMIVTLGYDAFQAQCSQLPQIAPIGRPMQLGSSTTAPVGGAPARHPLLDDPEVKRRLAASGVTEEQVLKHNGLGMLAEGGK